VLDSPLYVPVAPQPGRPACFGPQRIYTAICT